ncbi:uncharacterized protein LOC122043798 [Zingiber officinale]|uniref:uncharacterized protein LOC122043798 n=1 Tax=Zingiber officinale TaxID=94328 RepID=UPI001C4C7C99|nr:uncharacterized protein LOC122043798 [Zingiber officinale]
MISGEPTNGDFARARKSHERRLKIHVVGCSREQVAGPIISFGPQDLEGLELPHNDALIIKVIIANSRVARVFVDTGSSVNVLFKSVFEGMQIDVSELQPVTTSLYNFTDNEVRPMGQIKLVISLSSEPLVRMQMRTFIVMDSSSSYNVILGRPTLHEFRTTVFTFHQKIKFPLGDQVGNEEPLPIAEEPISWEEVQLYPKLSESLTHISSDLLIEIKTDLVQCLTCNRDIFAWSPEELPGVRPEVIEHKLHLLPDS